MDAVASCISTMYRAYQPILPTANLYLQEKWDRSRYETHRKKVAMAVPAVDTKGMEMPRHLLVNMKKVQMDRKQQTLIQQQNLIHSNKLSAIRQSHGRLDNWNFYPQRSLNAVQQRQNVNKISYENGKILERILRRESEYGRWESEWEKVKQIQANISRYSQVTWVRQHRVSFMDYKRNRDIQNLSEGSETDCTQNGSTKLGSIPKRACPHRKKEQLNLVDNRKRLTPLYSEKLVEKDFEGKVHCHSGPKSRLCKRGTVISVTSENANYKDPAKSPSDQKSFGKPKNCTKRFSEATSAGREHIRERKDTFQEEYMSEKSQSSNECRAKLKSARKTPKSYEDSDQIFETSLVESHTGSCNSLQSSEENRSSCSSQSSEMSETLSSLSINLKARMRNTSSTSLRKLETPVESSHKLKM